MGVIYGSSDRSRAVQDVAIQDQTTDAVILPLVQILGSTTLTAVPTVGSYTITVASSTGFVTGNHIRIVATAANKYYFGTILSVAGTTITVDTPIDYGYNIGSEVTRSSINLAVNGSVTPVHFHLRTGTPSIDSAIDITRMIMVCTCSGAVNLTKFGDISGGLTRGIVFRKQNGAIRNIFNVKTNRDLVGLAYDFSVYSASNPAQGINGFSWRLTFAGQEKMGVVMRIERDGQLGMIVQDNLSSLVSLKCIVEGHIVAK